MRPGYGDSGDLARTEPGSKTTKKRRRRREDEEEKKEKKKEWNPNAIPWIWPAES
jgi:hypothetical protein